MHPNEKLLVDALLRAFDLLGTFVFGLSGGLAAARHRLDLFGILVLSCAAATFGGITRDVLIGAIPPASIQDWRYLEVLPLCPGRVSMLLVLCFSFPPLRWPWRVRSFASEFG